jgi:hypothetical protein
MLKWSARQSGLFDILIDDGRPLLSLTAVALIGSGLFPRNKTPERHTPHRSGVSIQMRARLRRLNGDCSCVRLALRVGVLH